MVAAPGGCRCPVTIQMTTGWGKPHTRRLAKRRIPQPPVGQPCESGGGGPTWAVGRGPGIRGVPPHYATPPEWLPAVRSTTGGGHPNSATRDAPCKWGGERPTRGFLASKSARQGPKWVVAAADTPCQAVREYDVSNRAVRCLPGSLWGERAGAPRVLAAPRAVGATHHRRKSAAERITDFFPTPLILDVWLSDLRGAVHSLGTNPTSGGPLTAVSHTIGSQSVRTPVRGRWLPVGEPRRGSAEGCG